MGKSWKDRLPPEGVPEATIEAARSPKGGWTASTLRQWGIFWPPPAGWRRELVARSKRFATTGKPDPGRASEDIQRKIVERYAAFKEAGHRCQCCGESRVALVVVDPLDCPLDADKFKVLCKNCDAGRREMAADLAKERAAGNVIWGDSWPEESSTPH